MAPESHSSGPRLVSVAVNETSRGLPILCAVPKTFLESIREQHLSGDPAYWYRRSA